MLRLAIVNQSVLCHVLSEVVMRFNIHSNNNNVVVCVAAANHHIIDKNAIDVGGKATFDMPLGKVERLKNSSGYTKPTLSPTFTCEAKNLIH